MSKPLEDLNAWVYPRLPSDWDEHPAWKRGAYARLRGEPRVPGWTIFDRGWDAMDEALKTTRFRCSRCGAVHPPQATELPVVEARR